MPPSKKKHDNNTHEQMAEDSTKETTETPLNIKHFEELKNLMESTNERIKQMEEKMNQNHNELLSKITKVEATANEALSLARNNQNVINDINESNQYVEENLEKKLKDEIEKATKAIKEEININKLEVQLKSFSIELEDLRNRSMRSTLIFKNIKEEGETTWEETAQVLRDFIVENLNLPYTSEEIDNQISRAHRSKRDDNNDRNGPRPIFAQFCNWRYAEEIKNKIIYLTSRKMLKVYVDNMYSKDLTERRNQALMKRKELMEATPNLVVKMEYPAVLKSKRKGSNDQWKTVQKF